MSREQGKTSKQGSWWITLTLVAAAAGLCVLAVKTSYATNFGSQGTPGSGGTTNGVFKTNNAYWNVIRRDLTTNYSDGVTLTLGVDYDEIPGFTATTWEESYCQESGMDVCVFDFDYGDNNLYGWNACAGSYSGTHPNMVCELNYTRINLHYAPPAMRIACHELGHSVGLRHTIDSASCMRPTSLGGTSSRLSNPHDYNHIADAY